LPQSSQKLSQFIDIEFTNQSATIANIYAADRAMQKATLKNVKTYGYKTREKARQLCPRGKGTKTGYRGGRLASSIAVLFTEKGYHYNVFCDRAVFDRAGVQYYAWFVELGTYKMKAQPFLEPAHSENFPLFRKDLGVEIRKSLARREQIVKNQRAN